MKRIENIIMGRDRTPYFEAIYKLAKVAIFYRVGTGYFEWTTAAYPSNEDAEKAMKILIQVYGGTK